MKLSAHHIENKKFTKKYRFAIISDLHNSDVTEAIEILKSAHPNFILAPGDIFESLDGDAKKAGENGFLLLSAAAKIAPTFVSLGNHELGGAHSWLPRPKKELDKPLISEENRKLINESGAILLENEYMLLDSLAIGGLSSGARGEPDTSWLDDFSSLEVPKVLLCHHPEYYKKYIRDKNIELVVSGHAHGGQWRFFGRGVFAPGQGIFPKYTSGVYDGRLAVSRGMKKARIIPRIFNSTEVFLLVVN